MNEWIERKGSKAKHKHSTNNQHRETTANIVDFISLCFFSFPSFSWSSSWSPSLLLALSNCHRTLARHTQFRDLGFCSHHPHPYENGLKKERKTKSAAITRLSSENVFHDTKRRLVSFFCYC